MIEFKNVSHVYNPGTIYEKKALDNISIKLCEKKIIGLIGDTGSGKSTFVQHFNKLLLPTNGEIIFDNSRVGLVLQNSDQQIFELSIYKEIEFGIKNFLTREEKKKYDHEKIKSKIIKSLDAVGLGENYLEKNPFGLSGGEKKRLAIADILAIDPDILILDEPTAGLDASAKRKIIFYITKLHETKKIMIIIISHDMNLIAEHTEHTIVMQRGKIIFHGNTHEAFNLKNINLPDTKKLINLLATRDFKIPDNIIKKQYLVNFLATVLKK